MSNIILYAINYKSHRDVSKGSIHTDSPSVRHRFTLNEEVQLHIILEWT